MINSLKNEDYNGHRRFSSTVSKWKKMTPRKQFLGSHISSSMFSLSERRFDQKWHHTRFESSFFFVRINHYDPFAEKHPQSMMSPPPCFTVVFLGCNSYFPPPNKASCTLTNFHFGLLWPHYVMWSCGFNVLTCNLCHCGPSSLWVLGVKLWRVRQNPKRQRRTPDTY